MPGKRTPFRPRRAFARGKGRNTSEPHRVLEEREQASAAFRAANQHVMGPRLKPTLEELADQQRKFEDAFKAAFGGLLAAPHVTRRAATDPPSKPLASLEDVLRALDEASRTGKVSRALLDGLIKVFADAVADEGAAIASWARATQERLARALRVELVEAYRRERHTWRESAELAAQALEGTPLGRRSPGYLRRLAMNYRQQRPRTELVAVGQAIDALVIRALWLREK